MVIRKEKESTVEVKRIDDGDEVSVYRRSSGRASKEEGMEEFRFRQGDLSRKRLAAIAASLTKKRGQTDYGR